MTREEREMELWERTYDRAIQTSSHEGATLQADEALKAFREAFRDAPPAQAPSPSDGNPVRRVVALWTRMSPGQRDEASREIYAATKRGDL